MAIDTRALETISYNADGLVPVIVQSVGTKRVLMMAWMNADALAQTLERGELVFWSRSRAELWHKGATSGNVQSLVSLEIDCDGDTLLAHVIEAGVACHTGSESCFDTATAYISDSADALIPPGIQVDEVQA